MATRLAALLCALVLLGGCVSTPEPPREAITGDDPRLTEAYSLLYNLVSQQRNLSKIFFLKSASDRTKQLAEEISEASAEATQRLEAFATADPRIGLGTMNLPPLERETRDLIQRKTTSRLLTGPAFEVQLLTTQMKATDYGAALATTLANRDADEARGAYLREFAERYGSLHEQLFETLTQRTQGAERE